MIGGVSGQAPWEAVRDHLQRGGSPSAAVYAVLAILALAALLLIVHRLQEQRGRKPPPNDPKRLFHKVLRELGLNVMERELLRQMASDLRLEHPTASLLSPALFDRHVRQWRELLEERGGLPASRLETLQNAAVSLFGPESLQDRSGLSSDSARRIPADRRQPPGSPPTPGAPEKERPD